MEKVRSLTLTRKPTESITIIDRETGAAIVELTVKSIKGKACALQSKAGDRFLIYRNELLETATTEGSAIECHI
jgi:sRNA-binding carbon storage regulator CsrA